jgi:hypothetical protein
MCCRTTVVIKTVCSQSGRGVCLHNKCIVKPEVQHLPLIKMHGEGGTASNLVTSKGNLKDGVLNEVCDRCSLGREELA